MARPLLLLLPLLALALLLVDAQRSLVFDAALQTTSLSLAPAPPAQIRVALLDDTRDAADGGERRLGIAVSWATASRTRASTVRYGPTRAELALTASAERECAQYYFCDYVSPWLHHVELPAESLLPDTLYYCALQL